MKKKQLLDFSLSYGQNDFLKQKHNSKIFEFENDDVDDGHHNEIDNCIRSFSLEYYLNISHHHHHHQRFVCVNCFHFLVNHLG